MASRLKLHDEFIDILETRTASDKRVYFNPPESHKMKYPCIKYSVSGDSALYANDRRYRGMTRYQVIVIDYDPDSIIPNKILNHFPMCSFDRYYAANDLSHTVLTLYY